VEVGHVRLKHLPATRKWNAVVALLAEGADVETVAQASDLAAARALQRAKDDPAVGYSLWLLTQIPLAARSPDYLAAVRALRLSIGSEPTLLEIVAGLSNAVDEAVLGLAGRTDLGEMARKAASEALSAVAGADLPSLLEPDAADVRAAIGRLASPTRFATLAREFFARLTRHHLDYYLSRTLALHVGADRPIGSTADHSAFDAALDLHTREASRIVETFAGGWFSKTTYQGGITPAKASNFVFVALGKISAELQRRNGNVA
jgi:hypothetical protein